MRTRTAAALTTATAALLLALTGCGQDNTNADSTPTTSSLESDKAPSPEPKTSTPAASTPKATPDPKGDRDTTPGGSINSWVKTMTNHGIKWDKKNEVRMIADEETRNWQGETVGAPTGLTFTALAITTPTGEPTSLSCAAAAIPEDGDRAVAVLSDCVTSARIRGLDKSAVNRWISSTLPTMLTKGDFQVEYKAFGELALTMDAAGDTASVELSPAAL